MRLFPPFPVKERGLGERLGLVLTGFWCGCARDAPRDAPGFSQKNHPIPPAPLAPFPNEGKGLDHAIIRLWRLCIMSAPKYRTSSYLNVIPLDDGQTSLLFNGVNGCLDEVPRALGEILSSLSWEPIASLSRANQAVLSARGHITTLSPAEERKRFRHFTEVLHAQRTLHTRPSSALMLLLSYQCNLACPYCYQQNHRKEKPHTVMSVTMVDELLTRHLEKLLPGMPIKELCLYGGEPFLLAHEPAIRAALRHAKEKNLFVKAISNATTRFDRMVDLFGPDCGAVNWVQVTLDGTRELHNTSRVTTSGKPTFDTILANIRILIGQGTKVAIRLNLDRKKAASLPTLLAELRSEGIIGNPLVNVYATPLHDNLGTVDTSEFMKSGELSEQVARLGIDIDHPISVRAHDLRYILALEKGQGLMRTSFCMQVTQRSIVVDPLGDIYACYEEAGALPFRVGRIAEGDVEFFPLRDQYQSRHLANLPTCLDCPVALACGGQCGAASRAKNGDLFDTYCNGMRDLILNGIKLAYQKRRAGAQSHYAL